MKRSLLLLGLLIFISGLLSSCAFRRAVVVVGDEPGPMMVYQYWYYPDWGIYYDYDAHVYFYLEGSVWHRVTYLPARFNHLGHYVVVESERGKPWARYESHRAKYPPGQWKKEMREDGGGWDSDHGHRKHHFDDD